MKRPAFFGLAAAAALLPVCVSAAPQSSPTPGITTIRNIDVAHDAGLTSVTLTADGPFSDPTVGRLDNPPRIYLDFVNVLPGTRAFETGGTPIVRRVRMALHRPRPRVTRVVVDLVRQEPFRIERDQRDGRRLRIDLGPRPNASVIAGSDAGTRSAAPPAGAPEPPLSPRVDLPGPAASDAPPPTMPAMLSRPADPRPPPAQTPAPASPPPLVMAPPPRLSPRDVGPYKKQVHPAIVRLLALRPLLESIDAQAGLQPAAVRHAAEEFEAIRRQLSSVRVRTPLDSTHQFLIRACTSGAMAAKLQMDGMRAQNASLLRNASSAAAGALSLLDRACGEVGCTR